MHGETVKFLPLGVIDELYKESLAWRPRPSVCVGPTISN